MITIHLHVPFVLLAFWGKDIRSNILRSLSERLKKKWLPKAILEDQKKRKWMQIGHLVHSPSLKKLKRSIYIDIHVTC